MEIHIQDLIGQTSHLVQANPFISGGLSVAVLASASNWLKGLPNKLIQNVLDWLLVTVRIENNFNDLYDYLNIFMMSKEIAKHSLGTLNFVDNSRRVILSSDDGSGKWLLWDRNLIHIRKSRPETQSSKSGESKSMREMLALCGPEYFTVTCFSWDRTIIKRFLEHLVELHTPKDESIRVQVYSNAGSVWFARGSVTERPFESVIMPNHLGDQIISDMKHFLGAEHRYMMLGLPYHRGYLLYGPPGSGKTSIVHAIASRMDKRIMILDLSTVANDADLTTLVSTACDSLLFIEDIDCLFVERDATEKLKISFSGLLNALDGLLASRGTIVVMTTNHFEKLDPALVRAGRIDRKFYIGNATQEQARSLFMRFFPIASPAVAHKFSSAIPEGELSMAAIQGHLLQYESDMDAAIDNISELVAEKAPASSVDK